MKKLYVVDVRTEFVIAVDSEDQILDSVNKYLEESIAAYTSDSVMANQGWGLHVNELKSKEQLQDPVWLNCIAFDDNSYKDIGDYFNPDNSTFISRVDMLPISKYESKYIASDIMQEIDRRLEDLFLDPSFEYNISDYVIAIEKCLMRAKQNIDFNEICNVEVKKEISKITGLAIQFMNEQGGEFNGK